MKTALPAVNEADSHSGLITLPIPTSIPEHTRQITILDNVMIPIDYLIITDSNNNACEAQNEIAKS